MKFEIPLYTDTSSVNESLRKTLTLLKAAPRLLERGQNEGALIDIRKALTNHLLVKKVRRRERTLDSTLKNDWINKSPFAQEYLQRSFIKYGRRTSCCFKNY